MQVELDLQLASTAGELPGEAQLRRWCELALRQRKADSELTIRLVDEAEGREWVRVTAWKVRDTQLYGMEKGDTRLSFDKDTMTYRKFEE